MSNHKLEHQIAVGAVTSVCLLSLLLFLLRLISNTSFSVPLQMLTSGFEEESLYAVWKYLNAESVYKDFHKIPFAASYFNYLFYVSYGSLTKIVLDLLSLSDEWIPQIGRLITLSACSVGAVYASLLLKRLTKFGTIFCGLVATFLFFGPLIGFWAITVRPDMWAIALETMALYYFISYRQKNPLFSSVSFSILCFLAWGFKQSHVGVLVGVCLFLLYTREWRQFITISLLSSVLYALSFYMMKSEDYSYLLLFSQSKMTLAPLQSVKLFSLAAAKSGLILLPLLFYLLWFLPRKKSHIDMYSHEKRSDVAVLLFAFFSNLSIFTVFASKLGASDNYFIGASVVGALILYSAWDEFEGNAAFSRMMLLGASFSVAAMFLVFAGVKGNINITASHELVVEVKKCIDRLPFPVYANSGHMNLPWINKSRPSFVLATTYYYKDTFGDNFESGGVEGLISEGYFKSVLNFPSSGSLKLPDELMIKNYSLREGVLGCKGFTVWINKSVAHSTQ